MAIRGCLRGPSIGAAHEKPSRLSEAPERLPEREDRFDPDKIRHSICQKHRGQYQHHSYAERHGCGSLLRERKISTFSEKSEQLLTILSSIAQSEAENISANSKWAVQRRFQNGTYKISTPAYGYEKDENGELVIQLEEAKVVRMIFEAYLSGKGCYTIAKELQAEGIPTIRNKGKWHEVVVQEILLNPVYEGNLIYQKTYSTSCLPFTRKRNHGTYPKYLITENHPPIITKEGAEAVRQIYEYRS